MGLKPTRHSPLLRGFSRLIDRVSGRDLLMQELQESRRALASTSADLDILERRLQEHEKQGKTGISPGWGYQSREMNNSKHSKLRALADSAATSHPLAKKAMRMRRNFICQEGFKLESTYEGDGALVDGKMLTREEVRERVQEYLDEHFEINWEGQLENRVETLNVFGELAAWMPPPNTENGQFRIGLIDSDLIESIIPDPLNIERAEAVKFTSSLGFEVDGVKQPRISVPIVERCWMTKRYVGEMLYLGVNTIGTKHRGLSDLAPVIDYLEVFDQLLWTEAERVKMLRSLMFQYIMKGETKEESLRKKQAEMRRNPPPPGSWLVTNESVEIKEICPSLNTAPSLEFIKYIFGICAGCLDLPEHFYYSAGDVNRASAREMTDPVYAGIRDRKRQIVNLLYTEHAYALQRASQIKGSVVYGLGPDELTFTVSSRDPERDALDVIGQHLVTLGNALVVYKHEGWISDEAAGRIARQELSGLGLGEVEEPVESAEDELARMQNQLDRVRTIDGKPENFPLSLAPDGKREWAVAG